MRLRWPLPCAIMSVSGHLKVVNHILSVRNMPQKRASGRGRGRKRSASLGRRMPQDQEILNVQGAAAALGVSERLVVRLAREGKIPANKIGREWRFLRSALRNYLAGESPDTVQRLMAKRGVKVTVKK